MLPCKQRQWLAGQEGFSQLQVLGGAAFSVVGDRPVSGSLRLSYRGMLEVAVCLYMSLYLHRLWSYFKFRALP